jgi:hypothetical protein
MRTLSVVENAEDAHPAVETELDEAAERALRAGATPPLRYLGAGMTGIVFCDKEGLAYKVGRARGTTPSPSIYRGLRDEAQFLADAAQVPWVRDHVAQVVDFDDAGVVIVRECVQGRPGGWGAPRGLSDTFNEIAQRMEKNKAAEWGSPEAKEDSFVWVGDKWVLVDAGSARRLGYNLLRYVEDTLRGRVRHPERLDDLAFYVRREVQEGAVRAEDAEPVLAALRTAE